MDEQRDKWMNRYRWMDSKINRPVDMGAVHTVSGPAIKTCNAVSRRRRFRPIVNVTSTIMTNSDQS